ncbi:polysaccharide deacetylase family protein [Dermatobacter hominis]|uniref:polysaccharide deacetylase family protein n=1 Tax=Dermatobacter hominis TaxID=2884263 RepID=UPI001D11BAFB|nr:polysaccharide deacetylase family protein [Dermatobacter hominis]UDY33940.1 polysaccharide deacetylase family protein [Dermatobacter hominis]
MSDAAGTGTGAAGASGLRARLVPAGRTAVKGAAAAADLLRRDRAGVTVLIYHRVGLHLLDGGGAGQMDVDPGDFDRQVAWLAANRRVLSLDEALSELSGPTDGAGPDRSAVVLTFDDGTPDWVEHALPVLERHRVPATFYVATRFVDEREELPGGGRPITWAALRELDSSDLVTVGSHTHGHVLLDRLAPGRVDEELDRSVDLLGEHLGSAPEHFAYPKAVAGSPVAESAVRRRFRSAVLAGTRANRPGQDPHRLNRSPVQRSDGERWFRRKVDGGLALEDDLRRSANRVRHRGRTT